VSENAYRQDEKSILEAIRASSESGMSSMLLSNKLLLKRSHVEFWASKMLDAGTLACRREGVVTYYQVPIQVEAELPKKLPQTSSSAPVTNCQWCGKECGTNRVNEGN